MAGEAQGGTYSLGKVLSGGWGASGIMGKDWGTAGQEECSGRWELGVL